MTREHRAITLLLLAFIALGLAYSAVNPLHEATDELRHYRFVQHIIQRGSLPVQGAMPCSAQGHHPPLYYALAAAATGWIDTGRDVCYEPPTNPFWAHQYWEVGVDNKNQYLHGRGRSLPLVRRGAGRASGAAGQCPDRRGRRVGHLCHRPDDLAGTAVSGLRRRGHRRL